MLTNTFRAFDEPSRMSLVPQLVARERLPNAIALGSIPWQAGRMIGPSLAGVLIAAFGGSVGFAMALAGSCAALALYGRMRRHRWPRCGATASACCASSPTGSASSRATSSSRA